MADDNLENLNKQLAEAQQKVAQAEEQYSHTREQLSKIGENYYKTTMLTINEQKYVTQKYKDLRKTLEKEEETRKILNKALDENTKLEKKKIEKAKQEVSEIEKRIEEAKKPGKFKQFFQNIGFTNDPTEDQMASQYRARQMAGGIEAMFEGRFLSGLKQLGSTIPVLANFMGGPLYGAMSALAEITIKAVDSISRMEVEYSRLSGGTANNDIWKHKYNITAWSYMFGQKPEDFNKFLMSNTGWGNKQRFWADPTSSLAGTWSYSRAAFEQVGANPENANSLISMQLSLGRSSEDIKKFNYNLIKATKSLDTLSGDKFISAYEELSKTFLANNINGMASAETLAKFKTQLEKGTLSVSDFTRGLTSRRQSSTGNLASVGVMLAERGLGGKELLDAYARGDMIAVAGAVRRGGARMQKDIEKIAPELARNMGTSDIREALAMQSDTPWGQLTGDLKKLEVQNTLASGGSLAIGTEQGLNVTDEQLSSHEKELTKETVKLKGAFEALGQYIKLNFLETRKDIESGNIQNIASNPLIQVLGNAIPGVGAVTAIIKIANPNQT